VTYNFQSFSKSLFLRRSLMILSMSSSLVRETVVGISSTDSTQRLVQDLLRLLDQRADLLHELLLIFLVILERFLSFDVL
jgi:hypothetical protein